MDSFNQLSPAEVERLALLAEECGEVVQIVNKILRHGYESYNPNDPNKYHNRSLLAKELGHVLASLAMMTVNGDIAQETVNLCSIQKSINVGRWLHHNEPIAKAKSN